MGELTQRQPKCFTRVGGSRLIDLQLGALRAAGIDQIGIVRGYSASSFTEPVTYFDNPRWAETNMVRSLQAAHAWLADDSCIVSYSDIFYSSETVEALACSEGRLAIAYDPDWLAIWSRRFADPLSDAETFRRAPSGDLCEIGGRPSAVTEVEGQYMGLLRFEPESWSDVLMLCGDLGQAADRLDMTGLLSRGLNRGWRINTVPVVGPWGEVDSQDDVDVYVNIASRA